MKMTRSECEKLKKELESKQKELSELQRFKGKVAVEQGDVWHDNFTFEHTEIHERGLICVISKLKSEIFNSEIVERTEMTTDTVDVESIVTLSMKYSSGEEEIFKVCISQEIKTDDIISISFEAPLTKSIFGKKVGFKGMFEVNGNVNKVEILKIE